MLNLYNAFSRLKDALKGTQYKIILITKKQLQWTFAQFSNRIMQLHFNTENVLRT